MNTPENTGHGHVLQRPDGMKAKCGGPGICAQCTREQAALNTPASTASAITDEQMQDLLVKIGLWRKRKEVFRLLSILSGKANVWTPADLAGADERAASMGAWLNSAPTAQPVGQDGWPKLEKPARLDGGTFGIGVSSRHVVEAAQRQHERHAQDAVLNREQRHEQEMRRRMGWDMLNGYAAPTKLPKWDDKPLRWCDGCGEGVTSFCRGKSEACPIFERAAVEPSQPETMTCEPDVHDVLGWLAYQSAEGEPAFYMSEDEARKATSRWYPPVWRIIPVSENRASTSPAPAAPSQHDADSRELRSLCHARDKARLERDLLQVDVAALEASVGHLCRLVDELRLGHDRYEYLRERPVNAISVGTGGVFAGLVPDNVVLNGPELDAAIDAALAASTKGEA